MVKKYKYCFLLIFFLSLLISIFYGMLEISVTIEVTADHSDRFQVFYCSGWSRISEKDSFFLNFSEGKNRLKCKIPRFTLKGGRFQNRMIRLDPTSKEKRMIRIDSLSIHTLWSQYDCSNFLRKAKIIDGLQPAENGFLTLTDDPHIYLELKNFPAHISLSWNLWKRVLIRSVLIMLILSLFCSIVFYAPDFLQQKYVKTYLEHGGRYITLWIIFLIFVLYGITLSNLGVMRDCQLTDLVGEEKLFGQYREVRTDEYMAHGLLPAIQQYNHSPKFPLRNNIVGLNGRNCLMLHDTGAPVVHISTLARPAVWGFFLFDLRRALSWLSLFPVFFGIFAFWFLLDTLFDEKNRIHLLTAVAGVFTMNSAVWSFWPVYNCAGTMLAAAGILRMLKSERQLMPAWGILIGWGGAVSAMTLYYPRVWYGGLLAAILLAGGLFEQKLWPRLKSIWPWIGFAAGILFVSVIFFSWYLGVVQDGTFHLMLNSTYPGLRRDSGGGMLWTLMIGWLAPAAVLFSHYSDFYDIAAFTNQCEVQEPMLILLPLLIYISCQWKRLQHKWLTSLIVALLLFFISFCQFPYPSWLINALGLARGNHWRMDYFIALGQIFLLAVLWHSAIKPECEKENQPFQKKSWKFLLEWGSIILPLFIFLLIPRGLLYTFQKASIEKFYLYIFCIGGGYFLITTLIFHHFKSAVCAFFSLEIFLGACVNPVCIAPERLSSVLLDTVQKERTLWHHDGRVIICTTQREHNLYAAASGKIFNGFFEYEDPKIFNLLFRNLPDAVQYHRLNHMMVMISSPSDPLFHSSIPQGDVIQVFFNGAKYDFRKLPVDYILEPDQQKSGWLMKNESLKYLGAIRGYHRFRVLHSAPGLKNGKDGK